MVDNPNIDEQEQPLERVVATSLDDLAPYHIEAEIYHAGRLLVIPLNTLTYFEWIRLGYEIPNPVPPPMGVDKNSRPILNYNDPGYLRQMDEAAMERGYVRLLAAIGLPIEGDTQAEKLARLKRVLDYNVVRQLNSILNSVVSEGEAKIVGRADTFQRPGANDPKSL